MVALTGKWFNRRKQRKRSFSQAWPMNIRVLPPQFALFPPVWFFMAKGKLASLSGAHGVPHPAGGLRGCPPQQRMALVKSVLATVAFRVEFEQRTS
jgi:hypothetical protein